MLRKSISTRNNIPKKYHGKNKAINRNKVSKNYISKNKTLLRKKKLMSDIRRRNRVLLFIGILTCFFVFNLLFKNNGQVYLNDKFGFLISRNIEKKFHKFEDKKYINLSDIDITSDTIKDKTMINVPYFTQLESFPTGCEIASSTMLLNYYGYNYTMDEVTNKYLTTSKIEVDDDGNMIADSPNNSFIGDPRSSESYGCFAPVIVKTLNKATNSEENVVNISGMDLDRICYTFLNNGIPVLVWETISMAPSYLSDTWQLSDGSGDFTWIAEEHCMVLVGYDKDYFYFNDPLNDSGVVKYDQELAKERFEELNRQAVAIIPAGYTYKD